MSPAQPTILVTGVTGHVGGSLAAQLAADNGIRVRGLVRNPDTATVPAGVEVVRGDLSDPAGLHGALAGVDAVFLVWPLPDGTLGPAVTTTIAEHAGRIVYLSSAGVPDDGSRADDPINQFHSELEQAVRASGAQWTFLRSGGMATNTLGWAAQIRSDRAVRWPYGAGARPLVHEADLAEVAGLALTTDDHVGATYTLTGPALLTQIEQAAAIGAAIGVDVRWEEQSRPAAREQLVAAGWSAAAADGALDFWATTVDQPEPVSPTFTELTGRPGRTFEQWAADHADDFR